MNVALREKRKVGGSTPPLTTNFGLVFSALTSANADWVLWCLQPSSDHDCPCVTVVGRSLSHADRTPCLHALEPLPLRPEPTVVLLLTRRPSVFRPDISPVGANRARVMRCWRSLVLAAGCCCCCHRCCQLPVGLVTARTVEGMAPYPGQARCLALGFWPECFRRLNVKGGQRPFPEETPSALDIEGKHVTIQGSFPDLTSSVSGLLRDSAYLRQARSRHLPYYPGVAVTALDRPPERARSRLRRPLLRSF